MISSFHSCFLERYYQREFLQRFKKSVSLFECIFNIWNGDCMLLIIGAEAFLHFGRPLIVYPQERRRRARFKSKTQPWNTSLLNDDIRQVHSWEFLSFSLLSFFSLAFLLNRAFRQQSFTDPNTFCLIDHFDHVVGFPAFSYKIMSLRNAVWSENLRWALCQCLFWMVFGVWEPALLNIGYFDKAILQQKKSNFQCFTRTTHFRVPFSSSDEL